MRLVRRVAELESLGSIERFMQTRQSQTEQSAERPARNVGYRWIWLVLALVVFGVLMGARDEFHSFWIRALLAGCAFAVLGGTIHWLRKVCD